MPPKKTTTTTTNTTTKKTAPTKTTKAACKKNANANANTDAAPAAVQAKYQKMDHREHVLARPGMYIGSVDEDTYTTWVADTTSDTPRVVKREIKVVPGLYKIFDEILVNAVDHATRLKQSAAGGSQSSKQEDSDPKIHHVKQIKIDIDKATGRITVWNNGEGIEVALHPEENVYYPELIFGHLLTSSNYDDTEERIIGGQNGLGGKCLAPDTKIPLFNGAVKLAKDIQIGDVLIGDDGTPRTVLNMTTGTSQMYEVTQTLGESYKVNDEHILTLHMPNFDGTCENATKAYSDIMKLAMNMDENKIFDISIKGYLSLPNNTKAYIAGLRGQPAHVQQVVDKSTGTITVRDAGNGDYVGFKIDGNERFLINDFTVTHNCSNIFSTEFTIETVDAVHKKIYTQTFRDNMSVIEKPTIKACSKLPYTQVSFIPDYERFKMPNGLTDDMYALMLKRCYDACAVTDADVTIVVNGKKLEYKSFERYADLYLGAKGDHPRFYESINDRWEVIATALPESAPMGFDQISFVNGIWTMRGGKHVEYIQNQIVNKLCEMANKKRKGIDLKPQHVKNYLLLFVKSTITNPTFDSQTKDLLTSPISKFGSKADVPDKLIEKLYKSDIVERAVQLCTMNDTKQAAKTDGKKKNILRGIEKLDDANWAGTAKSHECTLILTEGDSAKSMAIAGMAVVGRDKFGVFPLKGKLLNVQDITLKKLIENEEITNLKKIIGLETGKMYTDVKDLRYGKIMVLADQDFDGSHIKGLLFNLFYSQWPSLFELDGFLTSMLTPVIKAKKGSQTLSFYNVSEFQAWQDQLNETGWTTKYYKGLGTSTAAEAREYFKEMKDVTYVYTEEGKEAIDLAFNKKRADDRKLWLGGYNRRNILDYTDKKVSYVDFVHKDLIHFSNYDIERSIPNICDGLKTSQRKIMFCCFKRNITKEMRVSQLSGAVSECAAYHHGEASLQGAIIGMAQDFVGSNNINLLVPAGQFGTRRMAGKDAASPRYIQTHLSDIAQQIYRKDDQPVLSYLDDDGLPVEPEWYIPILPMVLVNGAMGIGTGFSTLVPTYNPTELRNYLKMRLANVPIEECHEMALHPWVRGFKGRIVCNGGCKYTSYGIYERTSNTDVRITELPVGYWTEDFKIHLEKLVDTRSDIKNYESYYTDTAIDFTITFASKAALDDALTIPDGQSCTKLETDLGLASSKLLSTTNMYLFNRHCQITKYNTVHDIIDEYFDVRMDMYQKRKEAQLKELNNQLTILNAKVAFIKLIINKELDITKMSRDDIVNALKNGKFPKSNTPTPFPEHNNSYDYLLRLPVYSLTTDKVKELEDEQDKCIKTIATLESTTTSDMWTKELDELDLEPYMSGVKIEMDDDNSCDGQKPAAKGKGKGKAKGTAAANKPKASAAKKTKKTVVVDDE